MKKQAMLKISLVKSEELLLLNNIYLQDFILQKKIFSTLQKSSVRP